MGLKDMIADGSLQVYISRFLLAASFTSLVLDVADLAIYTEGVKSLNMLCSNSSLPIANFNSALATNPASYFPIESSQAYWLSVPKINTSCYWAGLAYIQVPINASDIRNDVFTDKTDDRWILESLIQLPNCDVGEGVTYNAARNSTTTKYNSTSTAFARRFESCPGSDFTADDIDLAINARNSWYGNCEVLVAQQKVRQTSSKGFKSETYNCSLPLEAQAYSDCSLTYREIQALIKNSGNYGIQITLPLIFVGISLSTMTYKMIFEKCCPSYLPKDEASKKRWDKVAKYFTIFIDVVTVGCLIWGLDTTFPLRPTEPSCPAFLEEYRQYAKDHKAGLVAPLVLTILALFIKNPYFETCMTAVGLYEAATVFKVVSDSDL